MGLVEGLHIKIDCVSVLHNNSGIIGTKLFEIGAKVNENTFSWQPQTLQPVSFPKNVSPLSVRWKNSSQVEKYQDYP